MSKPQPPSTELAPEEAILFDQIGERLAFPAIQPTGDAEEQGPKHGQVDHERELISDTHRKMSVILSILTWDNTRRAPDTHGNEPIGVVRDVPVSRRSRLTVAC